MQVSQPIESSPKLYRCKTSGAACPDATVLARDAVQPNVLVRCAFYLSVFAVPFSQYYFPGTGDRIGVTRVVQALIFCAVLSQPRVCVRLVPVAFFWFAAYCGVRIAAGLWLTPGMSAEWWPNTFGWIQFSLPWAWVMFNVLQFPHAGRRGLWALALGCSLCGLLHIAGIGVIELDQGIEGRSTVFGENANIIGVTYAVAMIALVGIGMPSGVKTHRRLLVLPLMAIIGTGMAKTGSRSAVLVLVIGISLLVLQGRAFGSATRRLASLLLVGGILAGVLWQTPAVVQRFERLESSRLQEQEGRVRMLPVLWEMFLRSPIYGSGPDGYAFELTRRAMPHLLKDQRMIAAHNLALLLLVETGLIGFLLFSAGVRPALISAWRARLKPCGPLPLALLLPLLLAAITVSEPSHLGVFWLAIAYGLAGTA